jgi:hypothetical protein
VGWSDWFWEGKIGNSSKASQGPKLSRWVTAFRDHGAHRTGRGVLTTDSGPLHTLVPWGGRRWGSFGLFVRSMRICTCLLGLSFGGVSSAFRAAPGILGMDVEKPPAVSWQPSLRKRCYRLLKLFCSPPQKPVLLLDKLVFLWHGFLDRGFAAAGSSLC